MKRSMLLDALESVKAGVSQKVEVSEQVRNVLFTGDSIITFNGHLAIKSPYKTDFVGSVAYNELTQIITKITTDNIKVTFKDKQLLLRAKGIKAGLAITEDETHTDQINALLEQIPGTFKDLPENFIDGALLCSYSASKHSGDGTTLSCIYVGENEIIGVDNIRISIYALKGMGESILLRADSISKLAAFKPTQYYVSESWTHFLNKDDQIMSLIIVKGKPLSFYSNVFDEFEGNTTFELPDELYATVECAFITAEGEGKYDYSMDMSIEENTLTCKTQNARGWIEKKIAIDYDKEPINVQVNPSLLMEILNDTNVMSISGDRSLFTMGNFRHLLMHKV